LVWFLSEVRVYVGLTKAGESIQRITAHAKKMGCGWLASCSSVKGASIDKAGALEEGLCLELAHWARQMREVPFVPFLSVLGALCNESRSVLSAL
jgi:hypothetical protein